MKRMLILMLFILPLLIVACGGGGGSSVTKNPPPQAFTLSGTIQAAIGSASDGDVNDIDAPYSSNNDISSAQIIPNPVTLGGYVNEAVAGSIGPSWLNGDYDDVYLTYLYAGQWVILSIGDPTLGDIDLYLVNASGSIVDASIGTGKYEAIVVPSSGIYFIVVEIYNGASNYVLIDPQTTLSQSSFSTLRLSAAFEEGDVIVKFKDDSGNKNAFASMADRSRSTGLKSKGGSHGRALLMNFQDEDRDQVFSQLEIQEPKMKFAQKLFSSKEKKGKKFRTLQVIKALMKRSDVLYAEPNYIHYAQAIPNDTFYSWQWHYPLIHLPQAWDITTGNGNVIVGVIDTGVLLNHPDLQGQLISGYDFISTTSNALDGDGIDPNPNDPGDQSRPNGLSSFHGTHVTGTIAAETNNSQGVAGIADGVKIMPLRVLGRYGSGTTSDIIDAMYYAARLDNSSGTLPPNPVDIINMSLGGPNYSQAHQDAVTDVRNAGVIIIAAAGNDSTSMPSYPAAYNGVVSVSAVDIEKNLTPYSNFGSKVDVAAPGGDKSRDLNGDGMTDGVYSTAGDDSTGTVQYSYSFGQGTSMASPHIAGVASLMKSVNSNLTPDQFDSLLASGLITQDLGQLGRDDKFGHGLIDAYEAVVAAGNLTSGNPFMVANPASFNFDYQTGNATLSITNGGGGSLSVGVPTDNANWLTVTATDVDSNNLGKYTLLVDRAGLSSDTYVATITVTSSVNTINIPVIMQVRSTSGIENAGLQHVLLIDANTLQTLDGVLVEVSNGQYNYSFSNVSEGVYYIASGTNMDNDSYVCDSGESCGGYLTTDFFTPIAVDSNLSGLDFVTGFNFSISAQSENNTLSNPGASQFPLFKLPMK